MFWLLKMTRDEFLEHFADLRDDQLHTLRRSARLDGWSQDQSFYVELCKQFFGGDSVDLLKRQRFVQIIREMVYTDGRSLHALLWIADHSMHDPETYGGDGLNALAGVWLYLQRAKLTEEGRENLRMWMNRFKQETEYLAFNAEQCLRLLATADA